MARTTVSIESIADTTKTLFLRNLRAKRTGDLILGSTPGAVVSYTATWTGGSDTGFLAHDDAEPGTWYADIPIPDLAADAEVEVEWLAQVGTSKERWRGSIQVSA